MKRHIYGLIATVIVCFGSSGVITAVYYDDPSDYKVVNAIKSKSNLTQADVDKIKLTWLGKLQNYVAGTAGMLAAYQAGMGAYKFGHWAETGLVGTPEKPAAEGLLKKYLATGLFDVIADKRFWAVAGIFGAGIASYKILEPRVAWGIINRVRTFVEMCENLDVYNFDYNKCTDCLASMGSGITNSLGNQYGPQWQSVNAAWSGSNIAREKGVENLLSQASAALELLAQVQHTEEVQGLRARIGTIQIHLGNNYPTIQYMAVQERNNRDQKRGAQIAGAQQAAQLDLTKQQTSALWYGKISLAATALSNFVKGTLKTLVYINDHKTQIAGGVVAAIFMPYLIKAAWKQELPKFSS